MAKIIADRVLETSTTTGTGPFALAGAAPGFQEFSDVCANGDTCDYAIIAVSSATNLPTGAWEVGVGTWGTGGVLTRTTPQAGSAALPVNFGSGNKQVMMSVSAATLASLASLAISDAAYGAGWDGDTQAPTKNAVYDAIEGLAARTVVLTQTAYDALDPPDEDTLYLIIEE